jgi:hypothetical protein
MSNIGVAITANKDIEIAMAMAVNAMITAARK